MGWWLGGVCEDEEAGVAMPREVEGMADMATSWCSPDVLLMTELCPRDMTGMRSAEDSPPSGPADDAMGASPAGPALSSLGSLGRRFGVGAGGGIGLNREVTQGGATVPSIVFMNELEANMDDDLRSTGSSPEPLSLGV